MQANNDIILHPSAAWTEGQHLVDKESVLGSLKSYEAACLKARPIFLRFSGKSGLYTATDGYSPPEGECVVLPSSFFHGFILWVNGQVKSQIRLPLVGSAELPAQSELPEAPPPSEWKYQIGFMARPKAAMKLRFVFSTDSVSGTRQVQKMLRTLAAHLEGVGELAAPLVKFSSEPFTVRGTLYQRPVFEITGWEPISDG